MFKKKKVLVTSYCECYANKVPSATGDKIDYIKVKEYRTANAMLLDIPHIETSELKIYTSDITDAKLDIEFKYDKEFNQIIKIIDVILYVKNCKYSIVKIRYFDIRKAIVVKEAKSRFFGLFKTKPIYAPDKKFDNKEFRKKIKIYDFYRDILNSMMTGFTVTTKSKIYKKCIKRTLETSKQLLFYKHELRYKEPATANSSAVVNKTTITVSLPLIEGGFISFGDACWIAKDDIKKYEFTPSAYDMLMLRSYRGNLYLTDNRTIHMHYVLRGTSFETDDVIIYSISRNEVQELFNIVKKKCEDVIIPPLKDCKKKGRSSV